MKLHVDEIAVDSQVGGLANNHIYVTLLNMLLVCRVVILFRCELAEIHLSPVLHAASPCRRNKPWSSVDSQWPWKALWRSRIRLVTLRQNLTSKPTLQ